MFHFFRSFHVVGLLICFQTLFEYICQRKLRKQIIVHFDAEQRKRVTSFYMYQWNLEHISDHLQLWTK